ncbi:MAG: hypothetical protein KGJ84_05370 [Elusimicrobia bacterium]|nr:hypothetical protein [Elusimicrobiota bacterium]
MTRTLRSGLVVLLAAPLSASAAMLTAVVPMRPAAPSAVFITPVSAVSPMALTATLALLPAAAEGLEPAKNVPVQPAEAPAAENDAAKSGAQFDGGQAAGPAPVETPAAAAKAPMGSGLRMARVEHEEWLNSVVGLLKTSRTGRRVLRDIDAMAAQRGVPVMMDVAAIGNNGEFRYDSDLLVMDAGHLKRDPYQSAPILAHELQHVLQRAQNIPADALELEIESYTVESRVWNELGVEPAAGSFARDARARLAKDPEKFFTWLGQQYKNNIVLHGEKMDAYVAELQKKLKANEKTEAKTRRKRAAVERVLASMKKNGMAESAIEAHRQEALEPLDRSLRDNAVNRGWIERDLGFLATPEGRARFRAYSRGVIRRARALSHS